jgi:long-chain acyl-CoA synthetase
MSRSSLLDLFESLARLGDGPAIASPTGYRTERWTYAQLAGAARSFARELERRGVDPGERVLLWGRNSPQWTAAFWGCILGGAVAVPMDTAATPEFSRRVARESGAKLAATDAALAENISNIPLLRLDTLLPRPAGRDELRSVSPPLSRDSLFEIVYTSGTTTDPRGVALTHGNILSVIEPLETEIEKYRRWERLVHPLGFVCLLPLSHVFGQLLAVFLPAILGATVVFPNTLGPAEIVRSIRAERASLLIAVPRLIQSLGDHLGREMESSGELTRFRAGYSAAAGEEFWRRLLRFRKIHSRFGWRFWAFISGGATLSAATEEFWTRLGFAVIQGYGLTETASLVTVNHPFRPSHGSIGKPLPGQEVKLAPDGEILVRAGAVSAGYWESGKLRPVAEEDGWYHTGDLGRTDENGRLYFTGRRKNIIVSSAGMNVHPEDLEAALRRQPEVRDAVVIALEEDGNAEPCAVLLLRRPAEGSGENVTAQTIIDRANSQLAEYQRIRKWSLWPAPDFPRTPTQKPMLPEIRRVVTSHIQREAGVEASGMGNIGTASTASIQPLESLIARLTHRPASALSDASHLELDLSLSSLDRVELLSELENRYQMELNESDFASARTLADVRRLLEAPPSARNEFHYPRWPQSLATVWLRAAAYRLLVWPAVEILARPRVLGREHLHGLQGPVLVICNHVTEKDAGLVFFALPAKIRRRLAIAMNGERLRDLRTPPAPGSLLLRTYRGIQYALLEALFNVFPLPQQAGARESFSFAGDLADRGNSILIFPEGRITGEGNLSPFRPGIGLLATRLRLPVVPVRIDGLYAVREANNLFAPAGDVTIRVGAPVRFSPDIDPQEVTRQLEMLLASL